MPPRTKTPQKRKPKVIPLSTPTLRFPRTYLSIRWKKAFQQLQTYKQAQAELRKPKPPSSDSLCLKHLRQILQQRHYKLLLKRSTIPKLSTKARIFALQNLLINCYKAVGIRLPAS